MFYSCREGDIDRGESPLFRWFLQLQLAQAFRTSRNTLRFLCWWGKDWAEQEFQKKAHRKKYFIGKLVECDHEKKIWHAKFDGEKVLYDFNESSAKKFLISDDVAFHGGLHEIVIERENNVRMENENNACKHPDVFANGRRHVRIEEHNDVNSLMYDVDGLNVYSQSKTRHNSKGKEVVDMIEMHDKNKDVENSAYASPIDNDCSGMYALCMLANECSSPTVDAIIKETNRYADDVRRETREKYSTMRRCEGLDRQSFFRFLGLVLAMTLQALLNTKAYWRGDIKGVVRYPDFGRKMLLNRFQQIRRFLHLRDNTHRPQDKNTREYLWWQFLELEEILNKLSKNATKWVKKLPLM
ncbi:hypothetical protein GOP47_0007085 [Adiantum capillus-veneris]|uniref:PiggyBac transposable element-derived protein domain-containing protein n=1 Tax=Adiantum capillus-veneris TaxID=13818 RepID=A0A9D4ZL66_ADICA|nr:hypothetical protein GOP47_0007085 [Adiantum capillus-veneris]